MYSLFICLKYVYHINTTFIICVGINIVHYWIINLRFNECVY